MLLSHFDELLHNQQPGDETQGGCLSQNKRSPPFSLNGTKHI